MGSCLSKKSTNAKTPIVILSQTEPVVEVEKKKVEEEVMKKEPFEVKKLQEQENVEVDLQVRSSSCSKEEIDAILIQCGRLSRSSSLDKAGLSGKRSCGSKRSFDYDNDNGSEGRRGREEGSVERVHRHRSRTPSSPGRNGSGRRVSRSPGKRSQSPNTSLNRKPQKMVSVPATVSSLPMDTTTKRIQVKRTAASPRALSPSTNVQNQKPISLSRSNSRKNEHSPFRRNPLGDIDTNVVLQKMPVPGLKTSSNNVMSQGSAPQLNGNSETKLSTNVNVVNVIMTESLKPQGVARSRSSRLSRDLDINLDALTNSNPSYASLLLEDIQSFHQKSTAAVPAVTVPACVSKAHSIVEAVADLNSSSCSNLSNAFSENKRRSPLDGTGVRKLETKECFVKSKAVGADDGLMQPSINNYVTVRRGTLEGSELEEQESSGSNSIVAGTQQRWVSSSSWEPTSADSTDRWTSKSNKDDEFNPLGFQRQTVPDTGREVEQTRRRGVVKRKDGDLHQNGIGRGRVGPRYTMPTAANASI